MLNFLLSEVTVPLWLLLLLGLFFVWATSSKGKDGERSSSSSLYEIHGVTDAPYKMLLCVNTSLGMGKGKIAAQCGHASLGAYKLSQKHNHTGVLCWENTGCAKIAVKIKEEEMDEIERIARTKGLVCYTVRDAGRTQIQAGSRTVLAIGPSPVHAMEFTKHLKLL